MLEFPNPHGREDELTRAIQSLCARPRRKIRREACPIGALRAQPFAESCAILPIHASIPGKKSQYGRAVFNLPAP